MGEIIKRGYISVCVIILAALFTAPCAQDELSVRLKLPEQLKKETLPQFSARDMNGENIFVRRHLERMVEPETKRVALLFFATWCMPCAQGAAAVKKARSELKENGVQAIFVNVGEKDVEAIHRWVGQYGDSTLPLIMDNRSQMAGAFGLLEPNGKIIMPKILVLNDKLKPLFLLGTEGSDFPQLLWEHNP